MNRKQFIESNGATCKNWTWSWSFINIHKRPIIFGAWDLYTQGKQALILSEEWKMGSDGKKKSGYDQSREHIRLVEEEGYQLMTFPLKYSEEKEGADGAGPAKIGGFIEQLTKKSLVRVGNKWFACDPEVMIPLAEELPLLAKFPEGAQRRILINAYERNAKARFACIAHHGPLCAVCGFDFGKVYGSLGAGFIHVHHVIPLSSIGGKYEVDPVKDLIPVCPNCHAMIHLPEPPLEVAELVEHLKARQQQP